MTVTPNTSAARATFVDTLAVYLKTRVLIVLFLGFSAGLPLALSGSTLLVWMREAGVDLGTIGLFALVASPYTIKFLWAPIVDAVDAPLLSQVFGRRRGWLLLSQLLLIAAIVFLAFCNPATSPWLVAFGALLVSTCSATQDIVIDAFRIESLPESEQAAGMASYVAAYRIGMLTSTAGALFLVSGFEWLGFAKGAAWTAGYLVMAALVGIGILTVLLASEPEKSAISATERANEPSPLADPRVATGLRLRFLPAAGSRSTARYPHRHLGLSRIRGFSHPRAGAHRAGLRHSLQALRRVRRRAYRPVRDRPRFFSQRLRRNRQRGRARGDA